MYSLYNFETRGLGVISNTFIQKGTYVGNYFSKNEPITLKSRLIYDGWIETNPLGRYLNHNLDSNLNFVKKKDVVELITNSDINQYTELTVNYLQISELIEMPEELKIKFGICNYEYIEEQIKIQKNIL